MTLLMHSMNEELGKSRNNEQTKDNRQTQAPSCQKKLSCMKERLRWTSV